MIEGMVNLIIWTSSLPTKAHICRHTLLMSRGPSSPLIRWYLVSEVKTSDKKDHFPMNFLWTVFEGRQIITFSCLGTLLEFFHFPLRMMTHPLAVVHNEDIHPRWVFQPRQQLGQSPQICTVSHGRTFEYQKFSNFRYTIFQHKSQKWMPKDDLSA